MSILSNSNAIADSGADYFIEGSLRYDNNNSQYMHRIPTTTSDRKKWTLSFWYKAGRNPYTHDVVYSARNGNLQTNVWVGQYIRVRSENSSGTNIGDVYINARYYDPTTWMHVVVVFDVANATTADRVKIYVNGQRESVTTSTSFSNTNHAINTANIEHTIGKEATQNDELDGFLTEFHFLDGVAKDVTDFGVEDNNGVWQPVEYTGTDYGTNGFYLKMDRGEETLFSSYRTDLYNKYVGVADNNAIEPASGEFCIEFWCRPDTLPSSQENYICKGGSGYNAYAIGRYGAGTNDGKLVIYGSSSGSSWDVFNGETFGYVSTDVWHHLAFYRIGNNFYGAVNGHVRFIKTYSGAIWNNGSDLFIGSDGGDSSNADIWASNFRMVKGNSVYGTSNFTPPSSPLTAISGTGVLTLQSSTFTDNSGNGLTISTYNSPTMTSFSLGFPECIRDHSGNNNQWLPKFFYLQTASYNTQSGTKDSPTLTDEDTATYPSMYPLQGNDQFTSQESGWGVYCDANDYGTAATMAIPKTGKWYWEGRVRNNAYQPNHAMGIASVDVFEQDDLYDVAKTGGLNYGSGVYTYAYNSEGNKMTSSSTASYGDSWGSVNQFIGVAVDMDAGKIWFSKNGVWQNSGDPAAGTNAAWSIWTDKEYVPIYHSWTAGNGMRFNFGQYRYNNGNNGFFYAPPTGFKKLNTYNLPDSSVIKASDYFNTVLWTGNSTADRAITGVGFQPDFVWLKTRSNGGQSHHLVDAVRGAGTNCMNTIYSNLTAVEDGTGTNSSLNNYYGAIESLDSDGFTVDKTGNNSYQQVNNSGWTYVAWNWKANGSGVSNTDGSITSTVSANTTAGFSIVTYTGNATNSTVGHGLGVTPSMIAVKCRDNTQNWGIWHKGLSTNAHILQFNTNNSELNRPNFFNSGSHSSSTFNLGVDNATNDNGSDHVAYVFADVEGYSKFGSYKANGNSNGTFIYTGFKPAFVIMKNIDRGQEWIMIDSTRSGYNRMDDYLQTHNDNAEGSGANGIDMMTNGFKIRTSGDGINYASGDDFIYMAFAENPLKNARRN